MYRLLVAGLAGKADLLGVVYLVLGNYCQKETHIHSVSITRVKQTNTTMTPLKIIFLLTALSLLMSVVSSKPSPTSDGQQNKGK